MCAIPRTALSSRWCRWRTGTCGFTESRETDEDGTFAPVENGYAISDGKDHSYYVGELVPGGPTEKKLLAIAEKNGQTIPTVKTQEDIKK